MDGFTRNRRCGLSHGSKSRVSLPIFLNTFLECERKNFGFFFLVQKLQLPKRKRNVSELINGDIFKFLGSIY